MSCIFVYKKNKNGDKVAVSAKVENVLSEGTFSNSITFDKIVRNPFVKNEDAVSSFLSIYSDNFKERFGAKSDLSTDSKITNESLSDKQNIAAIQIASNMENATMLFKVDKSELINKQEKYKIPEEFSGKEVYTTNREIANAHKPITSNDIIIANIKGESSKTFFDAEDIVEYQSVGGRETIIEKTGEPKLFFKNHKNEVFENYSEAIKNTDTGFIQMGFVTTEDVESVSSESDFENSSADFVASGSKYKLNNEESFVQILEIDSNSDYTSVEGITNDLIKKGFISDQTVYENGVFLLEANGSSSLAQTYNANTAKQIVEEKIGHSPENVEVIANRFLTIEDARPNTKVMRDREGNKIRVTSEELLSAYKNGKLNSKYENIDSIDENIIGAEMERNDFYAMKNESDTNVETEEQLKSKLNKIFSKLGISITTLQEYSKKYKSKYGTDPSIRALADIANKVIAFAEGRDTIENMTEEVAHFIIEAFKDQNTINQLADEVHTTKEWKEESDMYREKYRNQAENEKELDKMVRREILGKVLQNKILEKNNSSEEFEKENDSMFDKLLDLLNDFVERVKSFFNPEIKSEFERVIDDIAKSVINGTITEAISEDNIGKKYQKTYFNTKTFLDLFEAYFAGLHFLAKGGQKSQLNFQLNMLRDADEKTNISNFLTYLENEIKRLSQKAESIRNSKEKIDDFDILSMTSILQSGKTILDSLKTSLDKEKFLGESSEAFSKRIELLQNQMSYLNGMKPYIYRASIKKLITDIEENPNYPEDFKKKAIKMLEDELEKVGWYRNFFGIMTNSNNAFLQLMGKLVHDMTTRTNTKVVERIKPMVRFYEKMKFNSQEVAKLFMSKDENGEVDGYIISNGKHALYEKKLNEFVYNVYKKYIGDKLGETFTLEDFTENKTKWKYKIDSALESESETFTKIANEIEDFRLKHEEMPMSEDFYKHQRRVREILNLTSYTTNFLSSIRYRRWEILNKYKDKNTGKINMQDISPSDKVALETINRERQERKSPINSFDGSEKEGFDRIISVELTMIDRFNAIAFAKDKQAAIDEFNKIYHTDVTLNDILSFNRTVNQAFIDMIREIEESEGSEEAFKTLMANGGFSFNDDFWNSFGDESLKEKLTSLLSSTNHNMLGEIRTLLNKMDEKNQILKLYTDRLNPSEVNGAEMSETQQEKVRILEEEISNLTELIAANVKEFREFREGKKDSSKNNSESTTNTSYKKALIESGFEGNGSKEDYEKEIEFIKKHTTIKNKYAIDKFIKNLRSGNLTPSMIEFIMKIKGIDPNLFSGMNRNDIDSYFKTQIVDKMSETDKMNLEIAYGHTKLSSYFKRLAPKGFEELMENMRNGTVSVVSVVEQLQNPNNNVRTNSVLDFMKINAESSWMEDVSGNTMTNPNYKGSLNGVRQFKKTSEFYNKDFYKKMGISEKDIDEFENDMLEFNPEKASRKEFALWQMFIRAKKDSLDKYGMRHNSIFELPQFSKGHINKWATILKNPVEGTKNAIRDVMSVRVDSQEYGAKNQDGTDLQELTGVRTLPKFGIRTLEEKSDISEELIYSYSALLTHAISYETKLEHLEEANAIGIALEHKGEQQGLDEKTSGAYAWKQSMDNFFYGISEMYKVQLFDGKVDVGKIVRTYNGLVSKVNLALNPFISATSFFTAKVNLHLWKNDYFDKESYEWSQGEFKRLLPSFMMDTGKRMAVSRLALLAEITGYDDLNERLKNASYNKLMRLAERAPQSLNEMANIPIRYSILLATLDDVRLYKGNFIQSKVFYSLEEHKGKTKEQIKNEWSALRKDSVYNSIITKKDGSYELRDDIKPYKESFDKAMLYIAGMTRKANSETDGVLSKADNINIKRNFALSAILMHKTFLSLNIDKRFKKRHLNFTTGREEVGSYYRFWEIATEAYANMPNKSFGEFMKSVSEVYSKLSNEEKAQMLQLYKEWGVAIALLVSTALIAGYVDDDDYKDIWAIQAAAYVFFRTTSEFSQSHPLTGWKQIQETIQEPFVSMAYLKDVLKSEDFSFKKVKSGKYKGLPRIGRKVAKMWYFRSYFNLLDLHNTSVNYRKNNQFALLNAGVPSSDK